jgi:DNA repair protein SbcD/Mre11
MKYFKKPVATRQDMKFSHLADCHIGGWREPKMKDLSTIAFKKAIDISVQEKVDFILISGDLFNTSVPSIDKLKEVVRKLKEIKDKDLPVYVIAGSHDYSPSGKTMIDVLEEAGLVRNVVRGDVVDGKLKLRFTVDRSGAKIAGMLGKRGMLEAKYYEDLDRESLESEPGFKIFMFHTAITELKSKELEQMDSSPISLLPKGFDYYAGGHVHIRNQYCDTGYKNVVYPGPIFPNSFSELEKLKHGSFCIYEDGDSRIVPLVFHKPISIDVKADTVEAIETKIREHLNPDVKDSIVLIRVSGKLETGRVSDIGFRTLMDEFYRAGAYFVMKSTTGLKGTEFDEVSVREDTIPDIERSIIMEHMPEKMALAESLINTFSRPKDEGEKTYDHEDRIKKDIDRILGL